MVTMTDVLIYIAYIVRLLKLKKGVSQFSASFQWFALN